MDTLILGCTHYPLLLPVVAQVMGPRCGAHRFRARDGAGPAAGSCRSTGWKAPAGQEGGRRFFVSDRTEGFASIAQILLGESLEGSVGDIDIENFPCAGAEDGEGGGPAERAGCAGGCTMQENYRISILGRQIWDGQPEEVELTTFGQTPS